MSQASLDDAPDVIVDGALIRAWELELRSEFAEAIAVLRQALEQVGPGLEAARPRLALGFELIRRQRAAEDFDGAMWTAGRLILARGEADSVWQPAMDLMGALDAAVLGSEAVAWWEALTEAYGKWGDVSWDAVDRFTLGGRR